MTALRRVFISQIRGAGLFGVAGRRARAALVGGQPLMIEREFENPNDRNALRLCDLHGAPVGYVAREIAAKVAPLMDSGVVFTACVHRRQESNRMAVARISEEGAAVDHSIKARSDRFLMNYYRKLLDA